ncbi:hypothetical protein GQX73_g3886 [Xylaria multiplex]|uniref:Uncharacterized protein n=1 Tax=Xylaria multiplex TaxID=323545 RepID=A0A7C8IUS3_9PEZI|nr:hypothetical protein GQX73_g3886 [Xylaria multiplex]
MAGDPNINSEMMTYLGTANFKSITDEYEKFQASRPELLNQDSVSPRIFQQIFDNHVVQVCSNRTYSARIRDNVRAQLSQLGEDDPKRDELKKLGDAAAKSMNNYDRLLKRIVIVIKGCVNRVHWKKHVKDNAQENLGNWLKTKLTYFNDLLNDSLNRGIRPELGSILAALNNGMKALQATPGQQPKKNTQATPTGSISVNQLKTGQKGTYNPKTATPKTATPKTATPTTGDVGCDNMKSGQKRPSCEVEYVINGSPATKKLKLDQSLTGWWGPQTSRLDCSDEFFDVVNQWKRYISNPTHGLGTVEHCKQTAGYLERALDEVNKRAFIDQLLLRDEWNFRDDYLLSPRTPSFIRPGCPEALRRLGLGEGFHHPGSNDIKLLLGGGLSLQEKSTENQEPLPSGLLALVHSNNGDGGSLRGGGADDKEDLQEINRKDIRNHTNLRFRDPAILWEQLVEDAKYPPETGLFQTRLEDERPLMTDPARVGKFIDELREKMNRSIVLTEWDKVQEQQSVRRMETRINHYAGFVKAGRQRAYDFIHRNPGKIFVDKPKLNEEGGKDKSRPRYGKVLDKDFSRALGYAFRARVFQIFCLALCWKLYLRGLRSLSELLAQEAENLEIWDLHEELYMEWENNKWFSLSNQYEITQLETRYESREFLRTVWDGERKAIQEAIKNIEKNSDYYNINVYPTPNSSVKTKKNAGIQAHTPKTPSKAPLTTTPLTEPPKAPPKAPPKTTPKTPSKALVSIKDVFDLVGDGQGLLGVKEEEKEVEEIETSGMKTDDNAVTTGIEDNKLTHDEMDVDNIQDVTGGWEVDGDNSDEIQTAGIKIAVDFLEKVRDIYQNKLSEIIKQNEELDDQDPGNFSLISRNNIDAMAKNQILWSLGTEIHNLKRSVDPLSDKSYGKGADQNWELPDNETVWANTRPLPKKKDLPLEVTGVGLGSMPGEHWLPDHPRVFLGCLPDFGGDLNVDDDSIEPAGSSLFSDWAAWGAADKTKQGTEQQQAGPSGTKVNTSGSNKADAKPTPMAHTAQTINKLREILKEKNGAELTIRRLTRLQKGGKELTAKQKKDLAAARKLKKDNLALYKKLHSQQDATTRAQADFMAQQVNNELNQGIKAVEMIVDKELAKNAAEEKQQPAEEVAKDSSKEMTLADYANIFSTLQSKPQPQPQPQPQPKPQPKPKPEPKSESQIKTPAEPGGPLEDATKSNAQAHAVVVEREQRFNEAKKEARQAEEAVKANVNDAKLKEIEKLAQNNLEERRKELIDAVGRWRVTSEEESVQQKWDDPPETIDALRARLASLSQDWEDWVGGYNWSNTNDELAYHIDQWVLETISFVFECSKAFGQNPGHMLWIPMYENFWTSAGGTLERKRRIWLYSLVGHINHLIQQHWGGQTSSLSFDMPPEPPTEWTDASPQKWVLINQAEEEAKAKGTQPPGEPVLQKTPPDSQASLVPPSPYQEAKLGSKPFKSPAKSTASQKVTTGGLGKLPKNNTAGIMVPPPVSLKAKLLAAQKSKLSTPMKSKPSKPSKPEGNWKKSESRIPEEFKVVKFHENDDEKLDAWPDLKDMIQVALNAKLACHVLQENSEADYSKAPTPAKQQWPRPIPPNGTPYHTL